MTQALWMPESLLRLPQRTFEAYDATTVLTALQAIECIDEAIERGDGFDAYFLGLHPVKEDCIEAARQLMGEFELLESHYRDDRTMRNSEAKRHYSPLLDALEQEILGLSEHNAGMSVLQRLVEQDIVRSVPILLLTTDKGPYNILPEGVSLRAIKQPYGKHAVGKAIDNFMTQQQPTPSVTHE